MNYLSKWGNSAAIRIPKAIKSFLWSVRILRRINMDRDWKEIKKELLFNPEVKAEYDNLAIEYELIRQVIKARKEKNITQAELAMKVGTKQSNISRLEY